MNRPLDVGPDLVSLFAQFPSAADLPIYELVVPETLPPSFADLLAHEHHMTVTVEKHYGELVDVHLLSSRLDGSLYARKIVLTLQRSGHVVLFGIIRINLDDCDPPVREAILAGQTPLGRILIQHNVLRRIEVTAYLKIEPGPLQMQWFRLDRPQPLYGRLGFIFCDNRPAVELLEIVVDHIPERTKR